MAEVKQVTMRNFRGMELLSGELRVVGNSRRRRGVPSLGKPAKEETQACGAATDDGRGENGGGVATSDATVPHGATCAGAARGRRKEKEGTPGPKTTKKKQTATGSGTDEQGRSLWDERAELGGGPELPADGWEFMKAVNEKIGVVELTVLLLRSPDVKLSARLTEQMLKMAYEKNARSGGYEIPEMFDVPRPERD